MLLIENWLAYEPQTGVLLWKQSHGTARKWSVAGHCGKGGYVTVRVNGSRLYAHRIAWRLHYGEWPQAEIDHINRNPSDNRIANLRLATRAENSRNFSLMSHNTSGFRGVSYCKRSRAFLTRIRVNGRNKHLGYFHDAEEAARAYNSAAVKYHGEFAALNYPGPSQQDVKG